MHREGHVGIGFFLYSPFAYYFMLFDWMGLFAFGMIAMGVWSFMPDIDMTLPIRHRGPTHSIPAAVVAGLVTAAAFGYLAYSGVIVLVGPMVSSFWVGLGISVGTGFVLGFLGVVGHLIGDVLTPMGIQPWWPRSNKKYSWGIVYAADQDANRRLSQVGAIALTVAIVLPTL